MRKKISFILAIVMTLSVVFSASLHACAISEKLEYRFDKQDRGFAEGTISLTASEGNFWLYWADDNSALEGYSEIAQLKFSAIGTLTHKMYERAAIPADATKLIAINSEKEPKDRSVSAAELVFDIPAEKQLLEKTNERRYRFASYSDYHIDSTKKSYKYDEIHLENALDTAVARDVDFIVGSGDYVNNNYNFEDIFESEWLTYQRILADSDYCNPVYEGIGNHEIRSKVEEGNKAYVKGTGLEDSTSESPYTYFEKTINGDHFIFMSLEKGFRPKKNVDQFSDAQLKWLENLLKAYSKDGKNIYIIEHALFYKYGAGDRTDGEPYYSIPLGDKAESTIKFKALLQEYKNAIFLSGHTHIAFAEQFNFSDNGGTSAQMIHNSSVGGVRHIVDGALYSKYKKNESEGYIVDVFNDAIIFNGTNLYYNLYDPNCCYIIRPSKDFEYLPTEPTTTEAPTTAQPTTETAEQTTETAELTTETTELTTETTEPTTTQEVTETKAVKPSENLLGDVNFDHTVNISDATILQKYLGEIITLNDKAKTAADVNKDGKINILDVTLIQKYIAGIILSTDDDKDKLPLSDELAEEVRENLKRFYRYSSYDCYQALKKALRNNADNDTVSRLNRRLLSVVDSSNVDTENTRTVYFENVDDWSEIYVYNFGDGDVGAVTEEPGEKLTPIGKGINGHELYKYTIPDEKYNWLQFTDGENKTQTTRYYSDDVCYYIYDNTTATNCKLAAYRYAE